MSGDETDDVKWTMEDVKQRENNRHELGQRAAQAAFCEKIGEKDDEPWSGIW